DAGFGVPAAATEDFFGHVGFVAKGKALATAPDHGVSQGIPNSNAVVGEKAREACSEEDLAPVLDSVFEDVRDDAGENEVPAVEAVDLAGPNRRRERKKHGGTGGDGGAEVGDAPAFLLATEVEPQDGRDELFEEALAIDEVIVLILVVDRGVVGAF